MTTLGRMSGMGLGCVKALEAMARQCGRAAAASNSTPSTTSASSTTTTEVSTEAGHGGCSLSPAKMDDGFGQYTGRRTGRAFGCEMLAVRLGKVRGRSRKKAVERD